MDSNSQTPAMGIELRADAAEIRETPEEPESTAVTVEHTEPEPRRGLRDWLRFRRGEERIPLPTTVAGDDVRLPTTGPRSEFE